MVNSSTVITVGFEGSPSIDHIGLQLDDQHALSIPKLSALYPTIIGLKYRDAITRKWILVDNKDVNGNLIPNDGDTWHLDILYVPQYPITQSDQVFQRSQHFQSGQVLQSSQNIQSGQILQSDQSFQLAHLGQLGQLGQPDQLGQLIQLIQLIQTKQPGQTNQRDQQALRSSPFCVDKGPSFIEQIFRRLFRFNTKHEKLE